MAAMDALALASGDEGLVGCTAEDEPVYLRYEDRTAHTAIIGRTRFGKTTLLEHLILEDIGRNTGVVVLDAHGDLTDRLISLAPAAARERIVVIEVNEDRPFGLNLYECPSEDTITVDRTVGNVVEIFKKLFSGDQRGFYPIIEEGLRNSAYVIMANGYTMAEVPLLFTDASFRRHALKAVQNPMVLLYWKDYEECGAREQRDKRDPVLNKITRFLASPTIQQMVSQRRTTVPFQRVLDEGGTLVFRLAGDVLDRESVGFLGMVFLSVLSNIVLARAGQPSDERRRVHLYLDEYGRFATKTTERMLEEFGKYQIGITVAHQNLQQLPDRRAPSAASLVLFQLEGDDAQDLALQLDCSPRRTKRVPRRRTVPQYKEWDEEIWESEEYKAAYEAQKRQMSQLKSELEKLPKKYKALENIIGQKQTYNEYPYHGRCLCEEHRRGAYHISFFESRDTRYRPESNPAVHALFNPSAHYFFGQMSAKPAGTPLTRSGLTGVYKNPPILRYAEHQKWFLRSIGEAVEDETIEDELYEGYYLYPEAAKHAWFLRDLERGLGSVDTKWAASFVAELTDLLVSLYEKREFYFRSVPSDSELDPTPRLGRERFHPGLGIEVDTHPSGFGLIVRELPGLTIRHRWTAGHWALVPFPEAVAWLVAKVNELESDSPRFEKLYNSLQDASELLFARHRSLEHHKEYRGDQPVEEKQRNIEIEYQYFGTKGPVLREQLRTRHVQWYDYIEELDQTHADRRAEIANELATLPRFVAYCKLLDASGTPHEYRVRTREVLCGPGDPTAILAVRSRSRQQYGIAAQIVDIETNQRQQRFGDEPPPTISRRPRRPQS